MEYNKEKIQEAVLALLYLNFTPDTHCSWKSLHWDAMDALHEKGFISDPKNKNKSVALSEEGLEKAKQACKQLFT